MTFGIGSNLSWDTYQRDVYKRLNEGFQQQANALLKRGGATQAETRALVDQRNLLVLDARKPLSPFGKLYSEIIKPTTDLPNYERLIAQKGSIEATLSSVGKTRALVNRLSANMRIVGHGAIVLDLAIAVVLIVEARPEDRARVAAGQAGAFGGGAVAGWGGAWAGCASLALLASPSLAIPIVGGLSTGTACLVGGVAGGLGAGALGAYAGQRAAQAAYDYVTRLDWTR